MIDYFVTNAEGYIVKKGQCQERNLQAQATEEGERSFKGKANADTQRLINGALQELDHPLSQTAERRSVELRLRRDSLLSQSDWTQTNDSPLSADDQLKYRTYRQALRDITSHANWPNLKNTDWPKLES